MNIFDLDRTLRNISGSEHLEPQNEQRTNNTAWHVWQEFVNQYGTVISEIKALFEAVENPIILTSSQFGTAEWCEKHGIKANNIIERAAHDEAPPLEYKLRFINANAHKIKLWVDDCPYVCNYTRDLGIKTIHVANC